MELEKVLSIFNKIQSKLKNFHKETEEESLNFIYRYLSISAVVGYVYMVKFLKYERTLL